MKLKIVSEGTADTTRVVNAETNEEVEDIIGVELSVDAFSVEAAIIVRSPHLSIDNLDTQEIRQGDSAGYDGAAGNPDNRKYSEQASEQF